MNRLDQALEQTKNQNKTALIPFLTTGDPDLETTVDLILELERAGADALELGVPYSDPLADGPVIQKSSLRALQNRITILDCIEAASMARRRGSKLPFVLFTYFNPFLQVGLKNMFNLMLEHDISGLIIPDLPMEEDNEVKKMADAYNIHLIPLVAPTSGDRIQRIVSRASGFIYCVSSLGVTGVRKNFYEGIGEFLQMVRALADLPITVGFGISSREQVKELASQCDGVVVGSAIVKQVEAHLPQLQSGNPEEKKKALLQIGEFVRQLKE